MSHTAKRPLPSGKPFKGKSQPGCVVYFDPETFAQIRARAKKENTSFGEQVRCLVEWGMMAGEAE